MKVIMLNTMSMNGMISHEDGNEDFLSADGGEYVTNMAKELGCIIWGRKAYDNVRDNLTEFNEKLSDVFRVIVSGNPDLHLADGYHLANSPEEALGLIEQQGLNTALLDGGGTLNSSFLKAGLVDEIHLIVEPVVVGSGLPVVAADAFEVKTSLISIEPIHVGEVLLKYQVERS